MQSATSFEAGPGEGAMGRFREIPPEELYPLLLRLAAQSIGEPAGLELATAVDPDQYKGVGGIECVRPTASNEIDDDTYQPVE